MWCPMSTPFSTRWRDFTYRLRGGDWKGHTGKRIRTSCMNSPYRLTRRVEDEDNEQQG